MNVRHHVPDAPMSPGKYICMRRDSTGLDQVDVALAIAGQRWSAEEAGVLLVRLEADEILEGRSTEHLALIEAVSNVIRFDVGVYWKLVQARTDPAAIVPPICRECGCTWLDPCVDEGGLACAWANAGSGEEPLCTFCEPTPVSGGPLASDVRGEPCHAA